MNRKRTTLSALLSIWLCLGAIAQVPTYVPTDELLGWWPLDNSPNDVSVNGNDFVNNGAVNALDRFGTTNAAYQFNGINSYLITSAFSHTFSASGSFSVSLWIRKTTTASGVAIMSGSTAAGNFIWLIQGGASTVTFGTNKQQQAWIYAPTPFTVNEWTHYVGAYEAQVMNFYKDGELAATENYTHTGTTQANLPLYVGRGVSGSNFTGIIDDIGIWSRALTPAEILALYNGECGDQIATQPTDLEVDLGNDALFSVVPSNPPATYQWQTDPGPGFEDIANGGQYAGATTADLTVANTTPANDGQAFRCLVSAGSCTDSSDVAVLTVNLNTSTLEHGEHDMIRAFPNPATDRLTIDSDAKLIGSAYMVIDQRGSAVLRGVISSERSVLDLGSLAKGTYTLSVDGRYEHRFRLVKQ